jgi:probable selenium-dependent hydroxylase accessory protein YqeC
MEGAGERSVKLIDAFRIKKGDIVALVGAGGKTSTMFALGREAGREGFRVVITTTTRIYLPPAETGQSVVLAPGTDILPAVREKLKVFLTVVAGTGLNRENKVLGVEMGVAEGFLKAGADLVMIEADGAAGRPFKAPGEGEPVIPETAALVVPVVGIDCLGKPLSREYAHRPETISALAGIKPGETITPGVVARVLLHEQGYKKNVPSGSRWIPFINKVESAADLQQARMVAARLGEAGVERVVIGAVGAGIPVREVVAF